jgi:hypothetical protein
VFLGNGAVINNPPGATLEVANDGGQNNFQGFCRAVRV